MGAKIDQFMSPTEWHPAFIEALQIELQEYHDVLTFEFEHPLIAGPLKIDVLIIKKNEEVEIKKNIAQIFRKYNVIEYKSPDDYISIADYDKVHIYSRLYAVNHDVRTSEMSVTIVSSRKPKKLLKYLKSELGYTVTSEQQGIYLITGDTSPTQIIVSCELPEKVNLWLNHLSQRLTAAKLKRILTVTSKLSKETPIRTYINVLTEQNATTFQELMKMGKKVDAILKEAGYVDKWLAEGRVEGRAEGRIEGRVEGRVEGKVEGKAEMILRILSRRLAPPSKTLEKKICSIRNINKLDELADFALTCVSLNEFMTALK
jgi:hypothetical protein